jgi:lipoprotein|nr:MAG TPA: hypothetical protein [Herelleviridae sp.]
MKKLFILFLGLILALPSFASSISCEDKLDFVLMYRQNKLNNPNYIQVIKNKMEDESIPIVVGGNEVFTTDSKLNAFGTLVNNNVLGQLFRSNIVRIDQSLDYSNTFIIYPIKDMKRRYITGVLILGYNKLQSSENLEISLELVETYLSQILDICEE